MFWEIPIWNFGELEIGEPCKIGILEFRTLNPSGLRPDRRGARRIDDWRDG